MSTLKTILFVWLSLAFTLSACVSLGSLPGDQSSSETGLLLAGSFDGRPSPTPFQPQAPTQDAGENEAQPGLTPTNTPVVSPAPLESPPTGYSQGSLPTQQPQRSPEPPLDETLPPPPGDQLTIWIDPQLPSTLLGGLALPPEITPWEYPNASLQVRPAEGVLLSRWVYALVAPFPTITSGVSWEELQSSWRGEHAGPFAGIPILMDGSTLSALSALWGEPAPDVVETHPPGELLERAWSQGTWAIVPFEALEPRWKVLQIDGESPLRADFNPASYPLTLPVSLIGETEVVDTVYALFGPDSVTPLIPTSNRDPQRMTVLAMTGVTALVRATAYTMEQRGLLYPGRDVRDWLRGADLTHISNEVPFAHNCPFPNPVQPDMRFCSDPRYIELLEDVGTDLVELTGDHFADWGAQAMYLTLDLYRERGWHYYGGGADLSEARQALTLEHNGNRLALIGCNAKGATYAQAGADHPGAAPCDMDWLQREVARLKGEGYLPIVTFQHFEYYTYQAQELQQRDFRAAAQAGAAIVSGSQAHQPQAFEFENGTLIHYGLGNLFFDQYEVSYATRQATIDRHIIYNGHHIATELLPILFVDFARPRPMTPAETEDLLQTVFNASGW